MTPLEQYKAFENIQFKKDRFSWMPLGGLGEVGMNCMLYVFGEEIVPVDAGILFADTNNFGIESVYPDFRDLLKSNRVRNWLITHGHEDHIGAVAAVFYHCQQLNIDPPRFWAPPLAHALLEARLKDSEKYAIKKEYLKYIHCVELNEEIDLGNIAVKFSEVRHSTLHSCCLGVRWKKDKFHEELKLLHSGDFKIDLFDFEDGTIPLDTFDFFAGQSPDILFVDSTNSEREGQSVSESELNEPLENLIKTAEGRVFLTLFSSNLYRIANVISIAQKLGRKVCLAGRSMQQIHRIALEKDFYSKCPEFNEGELVMAEEISSFPANKQLIICSGSQGEFRSVLSKIANQSHPHFHIQSGDEVIFSSKVIPGNEKSISVLVDNLLQLGAKVHWKEAAHDRAGGPIHASGHGRASEIEALIQFVKPKKIIPVHGNYHLLTACSEIALKNLKDSQLGKDVFLNVNYGFFSFENKNQDWNLVDQFYPSIPHSKFLRLENFDAPSRDSFLRDRKKAGLGGVVSVVIDTWGRVQLKCSGILPNEYSDTSRISEEKLHNEISHWLHRYAKKMAKQGLLNRASENLENEIQDELERFVRKLTGLRPLAHVQIAKL